MKDRLSEVSFILALILFVFVADVNRCHMSCYHGFSNTAGVADVALIVGHV